MEWGTGFWLTRLLFQRALGIVYLVAFVAALNQFKPLLGEHGLTPAADYVKAINFAQSPSLFFICSKDWAFTLATWVGVILSCLAISGVADSYSQALSIAVWFSLWLIYLSFVNVGQTFYAFGWESILLEAGFFAIFLGPRGVEPPRLVVWMLRWLLFRVMFGAGLIKLRGDGCWRDLTCLAYHFETQPMPNPLSWYFHWASDGVHRAGVLVNHFAELVAPLGLFGPARLCAAAGAVLIIFQGMIMASGNLSWLNLLTMVLAISAFDDRHLAMILPISQRDFRAPAPAFTYSVWALTAVVSVLSIKPIINMLSPRQIMNSSYNPFHLVGTYGAFGGITRTRQEIIIEGTEDPVLTAAAQWREYEFKGKPGSLDRIPPQIAPYHLRLDWLMWFAAMSPSYDFYQYPWFARLVEKLLEADRDVLGLLAHDPFDGRKPRFIRAQLYVYRFTTPDERRITGRWWKRELVGSYLPPAALNPTAAGNPETP